MDLSQKTIDMIGMIAGAVLILAVGLVLIRVILGITRKALTRTTLDGAIYTFIISSMKIVLSIVLVVAKLR